MKEIYNQVRSNDVILGDFETDLETRSSSCLRSLILESNSGSFRSIRSRRLPIILTRLCIHPSLLQLSRTHLRLPSTCLNVRSIFASSSDLHLYRLKHFLRMISASRTFPRNTFLTRWIGNIREKGNLKPGESHEKSHDKQYLPSNKASFDHVKVCQMFFFFFFGKSTVYQFGEQNE